MREFDDHAPAPEGGKVEVHELRVAAVELLVALVVLDVHEVGVQAVHFAAARLRAAAAVRPARIRPGQGGERWQAAGAQGQAPWQRLGPRHVHVLRPAEGCGCATRGFSLEWERREEIPPIGARLIEKLAPRARLDVSPFELVLPQPDRFLSNVLVQKCSTIEDENKKINRSIVNLLYSHGDSCDES